MRPQKLSLVRVGLAFAGLTSGICSHSAHGGESLDRFGRLLGVGWSDGYHACADKPYQLGESLPPHSYRAKHSQFSGGRAACATCANGTCENCVAGSTSHEAMFSSPEMHMDSPVLAAPLPSPARVPTPARPDAPASKPEIVDPIERPEARPAPRAVAPQASSTPPAAAAPKRRSAPAVPQNPYSPSDRPQPAPTTSDELDDLVPSDELPPPVQRPSGNKGRAVEQELDILSPADGDSLLEEVPAPDGDDLLLPEDGASVIPPRARRARVAQTSANVAPASPSRISRPAPQRMPAVRSHW